MTNDDTRQRKRSAELDDQTTKASNPPQVTTAPPRNAHPVDGGWAWMIVVGTFGIHFFSFGYIRSFGILFLEFQRKFNASSAETAAISGVQFCAYSLTTLLAVNVILKRFSIRQCCLVGCGLQSLGIALNGIVPDIKYLIATQGILFGCGYALVYCPAMIIVSQYFNKKRALATVVATCGVSAGGVTLPVLIRYLLDNYGLRGGLLLLAAAMLHQAVFSALFTPISKYQLAVDEKTSLSDGQGIAGISNIQDPPRKKQVFKASEMRTGENRYSNAIELSSQELVSQEKESSELSEQQHSNRAHRPSQPYSSSQPTELASGTNRNKTIDANNHNKDNEIRCYPLLSPVGDDHFSDQQEDIPPISDPFWRPASDLQQFSESDEGSEAEISLLNETSRTNESSGLSQDTSIKPSIKTRVLNALSTSGTDLYGSLNSLKYLEPPVQVDKSNDQVEDRKQHTLNKKGRLRVPSVVKTVAFWAILVFFGCGGIASGLPAAFFPPLATEKELAGISTIMLIVSAVTELLGRLTPGFIIQAGWMRASSVLILPMAACGTLYQFTGLYNDFGSLLTMAILSGLFTGSFWATQSLVVIEVFGLDRLGPMLGFYFLVLGLSLGASHPIAGILRDVSGTYVATFHFFGAMYYTAVLMLFVIMFINRGSNVRDEYINTKHELTGISTRNELTGINTSDELTGSAVVSR